MRLLVTRAEGDSVETAARFEALGHRTMIEPLFNIEFLPPPQGTTFRPGAILFTSRNAVRAVNTWPGASAWHKVPVFAVGEETGAAAGRAGFRDVRVGDGNAVALAERVRAEYDRSAGTVLYPSAEEVAADIDGMLTPAGIDLLQVVAYRSTPTRSLSPEVRQRLAEGEIDGVVLYSRRTAAVFRDLVKKAELLEAMQKPVFFVMSEGVKQALPFPDADIRVAAQPDNESIFALVGPAA